MTSLQNAQKNNPHSYQVATPDNLLVVVDVLSADHPKVHNPGEPLLFADDLAAIRGDGIFETFMLRDGVVENIDRHAQRFTDSATMLDLPTPDLSTWLQATDMAVQVFEEQFGDPSSTPEAALKWAYSRGRESTGAPTGWITVAPMAQSVLDSRNNGVKAMTAHRGYSIDINKDSPWALVGAKTLSYAANMAALRYAHDHGLGDVIFVSAEGTVLEGPTSTVLMEKDGVLITPSMKGILPGTTQAAVFELAHAQGRETQMRDISVQELYDADSLWLVSSVRYATRVLELDGTPIAVDDKLDMVEMVKQALGTSTDNLHNHPR